jgi:hypothetical protein
MHIQNVLFLEKYALFYQKPPAVRMDALGGPGFHPAICNTLFGASAKLPAVYRPPLGGTGILPAGCSRESGRFLRLFLPMDHGPWTMDKAHQGIPSKIIPEIIINYPLIPLPLPSEK